MMIMEAGCEIYGIKNEPSVREGSTKILSVASPSTKNEVYVCSVLIL